MSLTAGTCLGSYEIIDQLGAGGMGEVYRAKDTKLGRAVALKFLSEAVVGDADRLARFEREAHVLASLNHSHIAAIYGLEHDEKTAQPFLVMELVEGEDLSRQIARGPIPLDEAMPIATQIAEALEAAHNAGVIHRDLKPANIKVRPDGTVKVLDFGLAKIAEGPDASSKSQLSLSPTITSRAQMTGLGVVLGTAAYMSPEQAKGRAVDKRADVWAYGAVLFEMLTGRRCFEGEDVSDTFAAILRASPNWNQLPAETPTAIRRLLRRCLERDVHMRLSDMAMARLELRDVETEPHDGIVVAPVPPRSLLRLAAPYLVAVVLATLIGLGVWQFARPVPVPQPPVQLSIDLFDGQQLSQVNRAVVAISPDGSRVVYAADQRLYLRVLSQPVAAPIQGTEAKLAEDMPRSPFFSPDGLWVGFWQEGLLKKVSVKGGAPLTIATTPPYVGASWGPDDRILMGTNGLGVLEIAASGGKTERVLASRGGEGTTSPHALPGGEWVLMAVHGASANQGQVVVQSRISGDRQVLIDGVRDVRHVLPSLLVFTRDNALFAQAFDPDSRTLRGEAVQVL